MNTLLVAALRCALMFLVPALAYAGSAQWDLNPISGDWNTAANWTPMTVPNGPADIATFGLSNTTDVSISANTEVNSIIFTPAATNPYAITASSGLTLTISGVGITNNSGITQNFVTAVDGAENQGQILFTNISTAGNSSILNEGYTTFLNNSTAGSATIYDYHIFSGVAFFDKSTAGSATIYDYDFSLVAFLDKSTAGSVFIFVDDSSGVQFGYNSSADSAFIEAAGFIGFTDFSTAGSATIRSAGFNFFYGSSTGGTAQIELLSTPDLGYFGILDISGHNAPGVAIGSLEGDETAKVFLAANNLTVGSNNLSTTFSGVIQYGGPFGGTGGSLTKTGTGALTLSGANTYTGDTNVNRGVLQVDGSITSNTFVNQRGTLAGNGTVNGNVTNFAGKVSPGDTLGVPGVLTVGDNYTQTPSATLLIQIAGADASQVSVLDVRGNANLNGYLDPVLLNGFVPDIGQSFTFMNYASFTGFFSHINNQPFDHGRKRWVLAYNPTSAVLFVVKNGPLSGVNIDNKQSSP